MRQKRVKRLSEYFKNGKVYIWKENFAIVKAKRILKNAFANIKDKNEITVIVDEDKLPLEQIIEVQKGYKNFTFDLVLPFELVGFLAKVAKALADEKVSIFAISAYSTDHILVKKKDIPRAVKALKKLGFKIQQK